MKRTTKIIIVSGLAVAAVGAGATTIAVAQDGSGPSSEELRAAGDAARASVGGGEVLSVEREDDPEGFDVEVRRPDGSRVEVDLSPTYEVVRTDVDDDDGARDDRPDDADDVAPADADVRRAADAALAAAGDGTVTEAEWDDGGYDVEVHTADGRQLDVRVDAGFGVVTTTEDRD